MMKRAYVGTVVVLLSILGSQPGICGEAFVGVIDMERALVSYHRTQPANEELERQKRAFSTELARMTDRLTELDTQYEEARKATRDKTRDEKTIERGLRVAEQRLLAVREYELEIRAFAERRKKALSDQGRRMRSKFLGEIQGEVARYAKAHGLVLVLDVHGAAGRDSRIVYRADTVDITDAVIAALNRPEPAVKETKRAP